MLECLPYLRLDRDDLAERLLTHCQKSVCHLSTMSDDNGPKASMLNIRINCAEQILEGNP